MRLFEAILAANHRAASGDPTAGVVRDDHAGALPVVALTCIDARLNRLLPAALGIADEDFIWLRNAGSIVTGPLSSTLRSLALACAIKGGREIVVLGHTDCRVGGLTMMTLLERFDTLGLDRRRLPENLVEFFGLFASERQNVQHAVEIIRSSPLIGPSIPVHGLLLDTATGRLEWLVNGYTAFEAARPPEAMANVGGKLLSDLESPASVGGLIGPLGTALDDRIGQVRAADPPQPPPVETPLPAVSPPAPVRPLPKPIAPQPVFRRFRRLRQR